MKFDERLADASYDAGAADERERIQRLARDDADLIDGHRSGSPTDILCANTLRHFADLLDTATIPNRQEER